MNHILEQQELLKFDVVDPAEAFRGGPAGGIKLIRVDQLGGDLPAGVYGNE